MASIRLSAWALEAKAAASPKLKTAPRSAPRRRLRIGVFPSRKVAPADRAASSTRLLRTCFMKIPLEGEALARLVSRKKRGSGVEKTASADIVFAAQVEFGLADRAGAFDDP